MSPDDLTFNSQGTQCAAWHYPAAHDGSPPRRTAGARDGARLGWHQGLRSGPVRRGVRRRRPRRRSLFDYRGFGASEGTPRQTVSLAGQVEDYHAALAAAAKLSGRRCVAAGSVGRVPRRAATSCPPPPAAATSRQSSPWSRWSMGLRRPCMPTRRTRRASCCARPASVSRARSPRRGGGAPR